MSKNTIAAIFVEVISSDGKQIRDRVNTKLSMIKIIKLARKHRFPFMVGINSKTIQIMSNPNMNFIEIFNNSLSSLERDKEFREFKNYIKKMS